MSIVEESPFGDGGQALRVAVQVVGGERSELLFHLTDAVHPDEDGGVRFDIPAEQWIYLSTKRNRSFSTPPRRTALSLEGDQLYQLTADLEVDGPGSAALWLIEYDSGQRLCHWQERPTEGQVERLWRTHQRHHSCCLAVRLTGRGRLKLGTLEIAAIDSEAAPVVRTGWVFDPARDRFDLDLFLRLNEEYAERPLVPQPRSYDRKAVLSVGNQRARQMQKIFDLDGRSRVLEIGCGRGEVLNALTADVGGLEAVGVDVKNYPQWQDFASPRLRFERIDVTREDYGHLGLGSFDTIFSIAVWEHIIHPYAALQALKALLKPGGRAYLVANLHRGPQASHRYREVYFPWPHLLFDDAVFYEFYARLGKKARAAWVNTLTAAHYQLYFRQLGLEIEKIWYKETPIDEPFYQCFEDQLSRYPRFDLEKDFIHAVLRKP